MGIAALHPSYDCGGVESERHPATKNGGPFGPPLMRM